MALKRIILEMGHGNDMHGGDYTKAALRAVQDCIHHSAMPYLRNLEIDPAGLQVEVTVGVQKPEQVDTAKVAASLPVGQVTVKAVKGGLDVPDEERGGAAVIATATVAVRYDLEARLKG
ncbi:MAG TPA: Lin0512 family protein [Aestuariivirga sp.]|nr:Lin0512 family protein [Aestuariivirga sp.]